MGSSIRTRTGAGAPADSTLAFGELAVDPANNALYVGDSSTNTVTLIGANTVGWDLNGTELVAPSPATQVGIGVASPDTVLHIDSGGATTELRMTASGTNANIYSDANGVMIIDADANNAGAAPDMRFRVGGTEAMRIDDNTNVGIGAAARSGVKLNVLSGTNSRATINGSADELVLENSDVSDCGMTILSGTSNKGSIFFGDPAGQARGQIVFDHSDEHMEFSTANSEAMRIDSSGRVGIGTTSPGRTLELSDTDPIIRLDTSSSGVGRLEFYDAGAFAGRINYNFTGGFMDFFVGGSEVMRVNSVGNLGIGVAGPSRPLHISENGMRFEPRSSAPASPSAGDVYFDSGTSKLRCYDGTTWNDLF